MSDKADDTEINSIKSLRERNAAWCIVDFEGKIFRTRITHVGRGRFLVLEDNQGNEYVDKIIDASNILGCDLKV